MLSTAARPRPPVGDPERPEPPDAAVPVPVQAQSIEAGAPAILVINAGASAANTTRIALAEQGMVVSVAASVGDARRAFGSTSPDLALLAADGRGGRLLDDLERMRAAAIPVIVLGPRPSRADLCRALDAGAEDWVVWPFHPSELAARCRAVLRRTRIAESLTLVSGPLEIDLRARVARGPSGRLRLTASDWLLLEQLARRPGRVVSHAELAATTRPADSISGLARARVARLRRRLARAGAPGIIRLVNGRGYRLDTD